MNLTRATNLQLISYKIWERKSNCRITKYFE